MPNADVVAEKTNPVCGDRLRLYLRFQESVIVEAQFQAYGCAPTLACGSALVEMISGMTQVEASRLTRHDIVHALGGLPARKTHAAALTIETLRSALESFELQS